jgi:hypothetical protein
MTKRQKNPHIEDINSHNYNVSSILFFTTNLDKKIAGSIEVKSCRSYSYPIWIGVMGMSNPQITNQQ